jgi:TolB-like protein
VIGRNTAFTYKGTAVDLKQIGRDLNVRYVLEGSVQRGGNRMRVNVQLIDAETGNHLWAERFDKPLADLFDINRRGRRSILRFCSQANDQNNYESKVIREPVKERRSFAGISAFMVS